MATLENHSSLSDYAKWIHFCIASIVFQTLDAQDLQNFFGNFKDIEGRLMGVVIFLIMCKKRIIIQLTSVQPPFCNIVTYSILTEQLRKFVPQERLFTCYTWLISSSRSRPINPGPRNDPFTSHAQINVIEKKSFLVRNVPLPMSEMSRYPRRLLPWFAQDIKQFFIIIRYKKCQKS